MDLLRAAPMILRVVLALLIVWIVFRYWRDRPIELNKAWSLVLLTVGFAAANGVWLEWISAGVADLPREAPRRVFALRTWHAGYLINASLAAMLPAALLVLVAPGGWRKVALVGVFAILGVSMAGILLGTHEDYDTLLAIASPLEFLGLAGWVAFFVAFFLGYLPQVDGWLAALLGVSAVYVMLTPMNEAIFRVVGPQDAEAVWDPMLVMQAARYSIQALICAFMIKVVEARRAVGDQEEGVVTSPA